MRANQTFSSKIISRFLVIAITIITTSAQATVVRIGDREWRQLTDTQRFSYNELASIYDTSTGHLKGSISTIYNTDLAINVDFSGWSWASLADTFNLFEQIPGHNVTPSSNHDPFLDGEANSTLGDFFESSFEITEAYDDNPTWGWLYWYGWTRDEIIDLGVYSGVERNEIRDDSAVFLRNQDQIIFNLHDLDDSSHELGVWLYRDVVDVSSPAVFWLLAIGLIGLISTQKQKN